MVNFPSNSVLIAEKSGNKDAYKITNHGSFGCEATVSARYEMD